MTRRFVSLAALPILAAAALTWSAAADKPKPQPDPQPAARPVPTLISRLQERIDFPGIDDPETKLDEALALLTKQSSLTFDVNEAAFRNDMVEKPLDQKVGVIPKIKNVTVERMLRRILNRIQAPSGATFLVRREAIEITTGAAQSAEVWGKVVAMDAVEPTSRQPQLPLVQAAFDKVPLNDALKDLARQGGINIVVDVRVAEKARVPVTVRLVNTPIDTAVRLLADMADLKPFLVDNLLYVTTRENADRMEAQARPSPNADEGTGPRIGDGPGHHPQDAGM